MSHFLPGGGSHWLMVYGDAQRLRGAFSLFLVYRWAGFRSRPNAPNLQDWVNFDKFGQKAPKLLQIGCFLRQFGVVMGHNIALVRGRGL